ncbi:hypothetical protein HGO38_13420 [Rhizobium sp. CG5]|uniref:COG3904 family protein n=1 Tax=Rhizobium sp. CG5 TaxID=2726076 RepID=UPI0020333568|nr:hypothetical protein [Rhizobium sp. CG5]MCM2474475.1 hypothetical protein [Rhizobium sp. CG5]
MRIDQPLKALGRLDDGMLMRLAFYILLGAAAVFLVVDLREINAVNAALPAYDPLKTDPVILPPALTEGVPEAPPVTPASTPDVLRQPIRFNLMPSGVLLATGTIDPGAAVRFADEIEARGEYVKTVSLDSPGGSVDDAIAISKLIRDKKLDTLVTTKALCASSCPIVLAGGTRRSVEKDAVVGVHQVFSGGAENPSAAEAMAGAQTVTARVARHLDGMGIGAGLWIHALETPPDRLYYLTPKEMADFKLTTMPAASAQVQE